MVGENVRDPEVFGAERHRQQQRQEKKYSFHRFMRFVRIKIIIFPEHAYSARPSRLKPEISRPALPHRSSGAASMPISRVSPGISEK